MAAAWGGGLVWLAHFGEITQAPVVRSGQVSPGSGAWIWGLHLGPIDLLHYFLAVWCSYPCSLALHGAQAPQLLLCLPGPCPNLSALKCGQCLDSESPPLAVTAGPLPLNGWKQSGGTPTARLSAHLGLLAFSDPSSFTRKAKTIWLPAALLRAGIQDPWPLRIDPHLLIYGLQRDLPTLAPGRCGAG